jgi:hypothetical protein
MTITCKHCGSSRDIERAHEIDGPEDVRNCAGPHCPALLCPLCEGDLCPVHAGVPVCISQVRSISHSPVLTVVLRDGRSFSGEKAHAVLHGVRKTLAQETQP